MSDRLYGEDYFDPIKESRFATNELTPEAQAIFNNTKKQLEICKLDESIKHIQEMMSSLQSELDNAIAKKTKLLSELSRPQSVEVEKTIVK